MQNTSKIVSALLKGNIVEGTRLFNAEMKTRIADALEVRKIQTGKKLIGETARKKTTASLRNLTEAPSVLPVSKNGLVPIKVITSHVGKGRWMAELIGKDGKSPFESDSNWNPIGYIVRQPDIPSPYAYSPCVSVFKWKGKRVVWYEVAHKRYQVYEVPNNIHLYPTDDAATSAYIASLKTQSESKKRLTEDFRITKGLLDNHIQKVATQLNLQGADLAALITKVRAWERGWQQDQSVTPRAALTMITNMGVYVRDNTTAGN